MNPSESHNPAETIYVDIWSDIVCPFCYIGKRHFEQALEKAQLKRRVKVVWHSFELAPDVTTQPDASIYKILGDRKGWTEAQSRQIHAQMEERARQAGLHYDFSKTIPANSRAAHQLLHIAHKFGVQDTVKEQLLKGYFTDGKNIDDLAYLQEVAGQAGIPATELTDRSSLAAFDAEVDADVQTARKLGIQGVPFFVLNQQYGVSGAQPVEVFVEALQQVDRELDEAIATAELADGERPAQQDAAATVTGASNTSSGDQEAGQSTGIS